MNNHFLKYSELNEALKLSQYRPYHGTRKSEIEEELNRKFGGKNRIYIDLDLSEECGDTKLKVPDDIRYCLELFYYEILDYVQGTCTKNGRTFKIGKVLQKLNKPDLLKIFNEDKSRSIKNHKYTIVISKHPYDIAGMSTDRGWKSCLNLEGGVLSNVIEHEVKEGSLVAYLCSTEDTNIEHPLGRLAIRPHYMNDVVAWIPSVVCYGSVLQYGGYDNCIETSFLKKINEFLDEKINFDKKPGKYEMNNKVYRESGDELAKYVKTDVKFYRIADRLRVNIDKINTVGEYTGDVFFDNLSHIENEEFTEFNGFEELIGKEIKVISRTLNFKGCHNLEVVRNLPTVEQLQLSMLNKLKEVTFDEISINVISFENIYTIKELDFSKVKDNYSLILNYLDSLETVVLPKKNENGSFYFNYIPNLKSIHGLPKVVSELQLTSLSKLEYVEMPKVVNGKIKTNDTPFFEGMSEQQIREKYNIAYK